MKALGRFNDADDALPNTATFRRNYPLARKIPAFVVGDTIRKVDKAHA